MTKRLMNIIVIATASMWVLTGCNNSADTTGSADTATEPTVSTSDSSTPTNEIDWSLVASGQKPADLADYNYPFARDSQNVRDYAEYFDVDNATAQHNLTVSMASNEALSKVLDQVNDSYISHELTDDKDMTLIIHTTPDITASSYNYVLAGDFAKGLVLPIEIKPDGQMSDTKAHDELPQ